MIVKNCTGVGSTLRWAFLSVLLALVPAANGGADDGTWVEFSASGVPNAEKALAAVDPVARRMFLFGPRQSNGFGDESNEMYAIDFSTSPPRAEHLAAVGPPPGRRMDASLVFDPLRRRLLLVGGSPVNSPIEGTEVWALSLDQPPRWTRIEPLGPVPPQRSQHVAVYDPSGDRVVVHGGLRSEGQSLLSDTWVLELAGVPRWSRLATAGAEGPSLLSAAAIYDSRRDRMVMYGGLSLSSVPVSRDVWTLSLDGIPTWSLASVSSDPPPFGAPASPKAVYDSTADRMVVLTPELDVPLGSPVVLHQLDFSAGNRWDPLATGGASPGSRFESSLGLLPWVNRLILFGGRQETPGGFALFLSDVFGLDLESLLWSDLEAIGTRPRRALDQPTGALDVERSRAILLAGGAQPETWILRLDSAGVWQRPLPATPVPAVGGMPAVYDSVGRRLLVFEGRSNVRVWAMVPEPRPTWSVLEVGSVSPLGRTGFIVTPDPDRNRVLMFGGTAGSAELWELRLGPSPQWNLLSSSGPTGRQDAWMVRDPHEQRLVLFGGRTVGSQPQGILDLWTWPLQTDSGWTSIPFTGVPPAYAPGATFEYDASRRRCVLAGVTGFISNRFAWSLEFEPSAAWRLLDVGDASSTLPHGPGFMDPVHDRLLFPLTSYLGGVAIQFGAATAPELECPPSGGWTPGSIRQIGFALLDESGLRRSYEYTLTTDRDWPGFPIRGLAELEGFSTEYVSVGIPVPDTAAFGTVRFELSVRGRDAGAVAHDCAFDLMGEAAPIVADGAIALPDRVLVQWLVTRPGLVVAVARRPEDGAWTTLARLEVPASGRVAYEDREVEVDRRYYYRLEVTQPEIAGAYGQIRVDVPLTSPLEGRLAFAPAQPNPMVGSFGVAFVLPAPGDARIEAFDVRGRRVLSESRSFDDPGLQRITLEAGGNLPSGVYFLRLSQGAQHAARRVVFLR